MGPGLQCCVPVLHNSRVWCLHGCAHSLQGPMKQMLKPFKPGEDRFAGMDVLESEATGAPIIPDAAAYLECR